LAATVTLRSTVSLLLTVLFGLTALIGCASRALPPPPEGDPMNGEDYVIGSADVLAIRVWKNPELSVTVPVRPDGRISVPLLDDVQAAGLTPEELKDRITESLRAYVANPDVTVVVSEINSKQVYVIGGAAQQGAVPLTRDLRVLDVLSIVGGFGGFADKNGVRVLRRTASGMSEYRFDYEAFLDGRATESNLLLQAGDTIVVPE
jgi:polysaccharide export outer membrane protein